MRVLLSRQPSMSYAVQLIPLAKALEARGHVVMFATARANRGLREYYA